MEENTLCSNNKYLEEVISDELSKKDPDHTGKAREFYAKFWHGSLSNYDGAIGNYRGDTIISFNTVAGWMICMLPIFKGDFKLPKTAKKRLKTILEADDEDVCNSIKENFMSFHKIYHALANFMPVINEKWGQKPIVNLNQAKGLNPRYRDFPDLFFKDVKDFYMKDYGILEFPIFKNGMNKNYFKEFGCSSVGWKEYIEANYLQDFFTDDSYMQCVQIAPDGIKVKMPPSKYGSYFAKMLKEDREIYKNYIANFLTIAISIIEKRAKRLLYEEQSQQP